ncbi:hypothetical protein ABZO31_07555 [Streptomyces sp. HUAS MG47]|uniref:hypothetical protein n=1 Tax=Streptomyces solicamelliae TaxID=3231716 RepID=UPI003877CFC3
MGLPRHTRATTALRTALTTTAVLGTLTACSAAGGDAAPTPTAQATTPAELCTNLVAYWVKEALNGSKWAGLDWEQKGLSNEQFALHDEVLAAARAKERTAGRAAALALADEESRRRCAATNGATGSSDNWRAPSAPPSR